MNLCTGPVLLQKIKSSGMNYSSSARKKMRAACVSAALAWLTALNLILIFNYPLRRVNQEADKSKITVRVIEPRAR
jgi:preprotein translocase subunit SecG